jgi:hypothetical protein
MRAAKKLQAPPNWLQGAVADALNALVVPYQSRAELPRPTRDQVRTVYETLCKLMPEPLSYLVIANGCGIRDVREAVTLDDARRIAIAHKPDFEHVCIQADVKGLRWTIEVYK